MAQRGGARPNAGRKKKPVEVKILDGNPGHKPIEVLNFVDESIEIPIDPPAYLSKKSGEELRKELL